jgi:hypothetical protein
MCASNFGFEVRLRGQNWVCIGFVLLGFCLATSYLYFFALQNFVIQQAVLGGVTRRTRLRQGYAAAGLGLDWVCFGFDGGLRG